MILDILERTDVRLAKNLVKSETPRAAMRPIELEAPPYRTAEQHVNRYAVGFALDVEQGILDRPDRLRVDASGKLARHGVEESNNALTLKRIDANDQRAHSADHGRQS